MRIAVISDIHGNCFALDAALADLRQDHVDHIVCLGDAVQGGAQPAQTVARLRELNCPVVMGNADAWLLTGVETSAVEHMTDIQQHVRAWSLAQLSSDDLSFIDSFQATVEIAMGEGKLLCFHGSPYSFDDLIFPDTPEEDFQCLLGEFLPAIMTGGHTHTQFVRRLGESSFFFNPGSIGVAYNRALPEDKFRLDPWAEYAILSVDKGRIGLEFRRVPLDLNGMVRIILQSGRPHADAFVAQYGTGLETD